MPHTLSPEIRETLYRLDGPLRWAIGEACELLRKVHVRSGDVVLDAGAGTGYLALPLARAVGPAGRVHCADLAQELLGRLLSKAEKERLTERLCPAECSVFDLPYPDDTFDFVFSSYLLHELGEATPLALRELHRVLKPLGQVALADYRKIADEERRREIEAWYAAQKDNAGEEECHLRFGLDDMEKMLLAAGFRDVELSTWLDFHLHAVARK